MIPPLNEAEFEGFVGFHFLNWLQHRSQPSNQPICSEFCEKPNSDIFDFLAAIVF